MKSNIEDIYLELLKKTLTFTLWPEPPMPIDKLPYEPRSIKKLAISFISKILRNKKLQLVKLNEITFDQRETGVIWPQFADTMIGLKRLDNLQQCIESVLIEKVEGDLIETGVWRGGACIFMRAVLAAYKIEDRKVFVADSFEGLPKPDENKYPVDKGDKHHKITLLAISQEEVENNFRKYGMLDDQVVFLKGWFNETLPKAPITKLSILRLDGDMYSSTIEALDNLYPKLSKGGFCIVDDYALSGCKLAVDDYRKKHNIKSEIKKVDWSGIFWRKE